MILDHDVGGLALTPDVGMEVGGEEPCRIGAVHQQLSVRPHVEALLVEEGLAHPRAVRAVVEAGGVAIRGDGDRAVLAVIGDLPPGDRAGPVRVVGERVAIGVIGDGRAADRRRRMRARIGFSLDASARGDCQVIADFVNTVLLHNAYQWTSGGDGLL
jgi:hypothetical protein